MDGDDAYSTMLAAVQAFHHKHDFANQGAEDLIYRVALMAEELGEFSSAVNKGKSPEMVAEELADLFILVLGTAISADIDLKSAFWAKMKELMQRPSRIVDGRVRVSRFRGVTSKGES